MNPAVLQKQLQDNSSDLSDFYKELRAWGEEMKRNQENSGPKNAHNNEMKPKISQTTKKTVRIQEPSKPKVKCTDYSAWDKFDADAECEKVDVNENDESDLTDECEETTKNEAYAAKEKGNEFVKAGKWDEAIKCYNEAINIYSYDPVFYANRALCFLKKENFVNSELDCTMSIRLDSTYVKAFQRRAAAREGLSKLPEAESDLLMVLNLEPNNKESANKLDALRKKLQYHNLSNNSQRPVSKFTVSRNKNISEQRKYYPNISNNNDKGEAVKVEQQKTTDGTIPVKAIVKPIHLRSKKPLKRIPIQEVTDDGGIKNEAPSLPKVTDASKTLNTDDLKIVERQPVVKANQENKQFPKNSTVNEVELKLTVPTNSVQFYSQWRHLKSNDRKYEYLKLINPENLPLIFKESLESGPFSEILEVLVTCFIKNNEEVFNFLKFFVEMRRFSTLVMFLSDNEKNYILKLFDYVRQRGNYSKEEIDLVFQKFELQY